MAFVACLVAWLVAGLVAVVALGAWWLWWRLPKRQVDRLRLTIREPKARTDVEDNFRKIDQLLLAAAALVGAGLAYLPFQQQQRSSHDVLISNEVAKGFELLGNKDKEPMQRLGGIYALEGVMNNSEDYHQPVLEALSAFVRVETKTETGEGPPPDDIQAALSVITRRKSGFKELPLFLGKVHIPKADLGGTNLTRAYLNGANLTRAHLVGADLTGAYLNDTNLTSANLTSADLVSANLANADLSGAFLTVADLGGANLTSADLTDVQYLTQEQLDKACGTGVRGLDKLDPPLTIKPC